MDLAEECTPILKGAIEGKEKGHPTSIHVYTRRWWITVVFCTSCFTQALMWNSWGPIAESSEIVFEWTDGTIAQITNMSGIIFAIFVLPFGTFMDTIGLRVSMLATSTSLLGSGLVRCFTTDPALFTSLSYLSASLQGFGGLMAFSGPALFAAVWFPLEERALITAICGFFNYFGATASFLIAPKLVQGPVYEVRTNSSFESDIPNATYSNVSVQRPTNIEPMLAGIQYLVYLHASLAALALVMVIIYFPAKPPTPPSKTASLPREGYKTAFQKMFVNRQLWIIVIVGALPRGLFGVWIVLFDVVVKPLGVSQIDAGWIGFWHNLIGCSAGIVLSKFSDILSSRRKSLVIVMTVVAVICGIWTGLLCDETLNFSIESMYASCILLGLSVQGLMPLFYEMSAETAYPVGEGAAGGLFTLGVACSEIIYLALLSIPGIGTAWMTWACVGSLVLSLPLMMIFKENNKRYDIDIDFKIEESVRNK